MAASVRPDYYMNGISVSDYDAREQRDRGNLLMRNLPASLGLALGWLMPLAAAVAAAAAATAASGSAAPADAVYLNGYVYTVDASGSTQEALAVRDGRVVYVGSNAGARALAGGSTRVIDVQHHLLMPGLVDGHMHPLDGGTALLKCNLNYERLTVAQMLARIQACLDQTQSAEPDKWLEVVNWFREAMLPNGVATTHATLDVLKTRRPIFVMSSFGHTGLVNARGLQLAKITVATPNPLGGRIDRDSSGTPTGILEDAAFEKVVAVIPTPTPAEDRKAAMAALEAMRKQGVTTFLDAAATPRTMAAFAAVQKEGMLTARAHFAVLITPEQGRDPKQAVATAAALAHRYDQGAAGPEPGITVRNVKLFLDGVITAPACTGAMLRPYFVNAGTAAESRWSPGTNRGPEVYFPAAVLRPLLIEAAARGSSLTCTPMVTARC